LITLNFTVKDSDAAGAKSGSLQLAGCDQSPDLANADVENCSNIVHAMAVIVARCCLGVIFYHCGTFLLYESAYL
jgi:hypothetical protein